MAWFHNQPIRQKLLVTLLVASGTALFLAGVTILVWDQVLFRERLREDLSAVTDIIADNTTAALSFEDPNSASQTLLALKAKPHVVSACVFRNNGTVLARYDRAGVSSPCPAPGAAASGIFGNRGLEINRPILLNGRRIGTLTLFYDSGEVRERLLRDSVAGATILLISLVLAWILSTRFRNAITVPIEELAATTKSISQTKDYGLRARKLTDDELGDLVDAFNDMLRALQLRDNDLQSARTDLERRVADRTKELQFSEERFRLLVERVRDYAIFMLDPGGNISSWNAGAERLKGYRAEEIIGKHFSIFYPPENRDRAERNLKLAATEGTVEDEGWRVRKDGSLFWADVVITALRDPDGKLIGFSKVTRDLTERKQAEEALRRQTVELARSNADLQQFAYVASHDLQEPLRMVTSYMQIIADEYHGKLSDDADECIGFAMEGAQRMRQLITGLLAYSRVGTGGQHLVPTDCSALINEVRANLEVGIRESGATVTSDPLPVLQADPAQMVQLFQNLVSNALTFHSSEPPQVHISAQRNGAGWIFSVADNGIGIAPEHRERIFVIFQRLHDRMSYKGTGIGLAICKKIVERRGGRIWVESAPGHGSTFFFTIPEKPPAPESGGGKWTA